MRTAKTAERRGAMEHRRRLLEGLSGIVLELGAGHGLNFPYYPATVSEVVAIEPEPTLRAAASQAAKRAPVSIRVLGGLADTASEVRRLSTVADRAASATATA